MRLVIFCIALPLFLLACGVFACYYYLEWRSESKLVKKYRQESRNSPWYLP